MMKFDQQSTTTRSSFKWLESLSQGESRAWQPQLLDLTRADHSEQLRELFRGNRVHFVYDSLGSQLRDLMTIRHPDRKMRPNELDELATGHLAGRPSWGYGVWCFQPWSRRLMHLLPEAEFGELRTSANRNRITSSEQRRLREFRIGIVGLSVGHSTAITLAQEAIGGEYRLADFDALDLSNLNRLRAGVQDLGLNKSILTARAIFEMNPFASVKLFEKGVTEGNVEEFLAGGGPLDIVFEECDSLEVKILIRERARHHRIAVVMETSDRGMLDVERFDRDPSLPLLHGLVGDVRAQDVRGLSNYEKVPIILRMVGARTISPRMAASMIDIETTLKTWPQLASAVALGGAINTDVARRIALGTFNRSGRFYVDLERLLSDSADGTVEPPIDNRIGVSPSARSRELPPLPQCPGPFDEPRARAIVAYASLAPSGGNSQPWRYRYAKGRLFLHFDRSRAGTMLDFQDQASYLALGSALENAVWTARRMGFEPKIETFPDPADRDCIASLEFVRGRDPSGEEKEIFEAVGLRVTNRRLGARAVLPHGSGARLRGLAESLDARLDLIEEPEALNELAEILAEGDRLRFYCERLHREMIGEIRWTAESAERTRDGVDVATLEMTPTDYAGMRLVASRSLIEEVMRVEGGQGLGKPTRKAITAASALGRITIQGRDPVTHVRGGRVVQRIWIEANRLGIAFQPLTALVYLFARLEHGDGEMLTLAEQKWLVRLRERYLSILPTASTASEMMLFRLSLAEPPTARSLRRSVDVILEIDRAGT